MPEPDLSSSLSSNFDYSAAALPNSQHQQAGRQAVSHRLFSLGTVNPFLFADCPFENW